MKNLFTTLLILTGSGLACLAQTNGLILPAPAVPGLSANGPSAPPPVTAGTLQATNTANVNGVGVTNIQVTNVVGLVSALSGASNNVALASSNVLSYVITATAEFTNSAGPGWTIGSYLDTPHGLSARPAFVRGVLEYVGTNYGSFVKGSEIPIDSIMNTNPPGGAAFSYGADSNSVWLVLNCTNPIAPSRTVSGYFPVASSTNRNWRAKIYLR